MGLFDHLFRFGRKAYVRRERRARPEWEAFEARDLPSASPLLAGVRFGPPANAMQ